MFKISDLLQLNFRKFRVKSRFFEHGGDCKLYVGGDVTRG